MLRASSLAAVINGLEYLLRETRERGTASQFPLLRAMLGEGDVCVVMGAGDVGELARGLVGDERP